MFIPIGILKNEDSFAKFNNKQENIKICRGMAVSKRNSPLLYNIEMGIERTEMVIDGISPRKKVKTLSVDQAKRAKKLLKKVNIVRVNRPKDFSLLTDEAEKMSIFNPNIANEEIFENTFNKYTIAKDKFPFGEDPFYKFDAGNVSSFSYEQEKSSDNKIMERIDMSKIASGIVSLNMLPKYEGKSKYFDISAGGLL
jgi:hypothetical protein